MTGSPAIFLPRISGSDMFWSSNAWLPISSDSDDHLALRIGQLDADHASAGDGRDARRQRRHVARDVVGELDDPARLDAARRLQLVHGDHRPGPDLDDVAADVEILEHGFEQARVALEAGAVDLLARLLRRRGEQVEGRQLVAVAERKARLRARRLAVRRPCRPGHWPRRLGDRNGGRGAAARPGWRGPRQSRSRAARHGARAAGGGTGRASHPRSSSAQAQARRSRRQSRKAEQQQRREARRAGDLRDCGSGRRPQSTPCAAARPSAPPQPAGKSRHRRPAGQAERNAEQHRADGGEQQPAADTGGRLEAGSGGGPQSRSPARTAPPRARTAAAARRWNRRPRCPASWSAGRPRRC